MATTGVSIASCFEEDLNAPIYPCYFFFCQQPSSDGGDSGPFYIRCRGLPWSATPEEVVNFFHDSNIVNGAQGIKFTVSADGRPSGECFAELSTKQDLVKALAHSNEHMGRRYVEVFESKRSEMDWVFRHTTAPKAGPKGEAIVRLRGLPFGCSKEEIAHFFTGEVDERRHVV